MTGKVYLVKLLLGLKVDERLARLVGPNEHRYDLLSGPEPPGLPNSRRGHNDSLRGVAEEGHESAEVLPSKKDVAVGQQVGAGEEVLGGGHKGLAVARRDEVLCDEYELSGLGAGLLGLRQVQVHLISIKVGIVGRAGALVEAEGAPGKNLGAQVCTSVDM